MVSKALVLVEESALVEIHGSRGAPLNDYIPDLQKMSFFRMRFSGGRYRETKATRVFISMMPMIFIFGFAKLYLLEKSYSCFMVKFELYLTRTYALFLCKIQ